MCFQLAKEIGWLVASIHNADVVHGDLTTSNFMLRMNGNENINAWKSIVSGVFLSLVTLFKIHTIYEKWHNCSALKFFYGKLTFLISFICLYIVNKKLLVYHRFWIRLHKPITGG